MSRISDKSYPQPQILAKFKIKSEKSFCKAIADKNKNRLFNKTVTVLLSFVLTVILETL